MNLFDEAYDNANHEYLLASFNIYPWIACAQTDEGIVGFSLGDSRFVELPRLDEPQSVALAGIACVSDSARRHGLFSRMALSAIMAGGAVTPGQPFLFCGRMAHAITYRTMARSANNAVPTTARPITEWQREVLECVAGLFDVELAPDSSVVIGKGSPIGFPRIEYDATEEEQALFASVDRQRGDSLLAISWQPNAPEGW